MIHVAKIGRGNMMVQLENMMVGQEKTCEPLGIWKTKQF